VRFAAFNYLFFLLAALFLAVFFLLVYHRKKERMKALSAPGLFGDLFAAWDRRKELIKYVLLVSGVVFSVLALMRPQWGFNWQEIKRKGLDIIVAIDVSKSMLASDVKPDRLERSRMAVKDLLKKLKGDRIGLVAFSGTAFLQCPLTVDYSGFAMALDDLNVNSIPRGGTSLAAALRQAVKSYPENDKKHRALIIITDGEDHEGDAMAAAKEAAAAGVKIFCIGIGSKDGELIQVDDGNGGRIFLKDRDGNMVKSRLNEKLLEEVTAVGSGVYARAAGADFGLDFIYDKQLSRMDKQEFAAKMEKRYHERFQIPLAIAFVLFLTEAVLTNRKRR